MTRPDLVPVSDLVHDVAEGHLTYRECLAILRARGHAPDITTLYDAVHETRRGDDARIERALDRLAARPAVAA